MELSGLKINILGDSITEGYGAKPHENCYVERFAQMTGAQVRNYGIGGTRIARRSVPYKNPEFDQDFCSRFEAMDDDADVVVVFGGSNDYGHGDAPLGEMTDRTVWTFYGACHVLFSGLAAKYPGKPIVIMTPLHRGNELEKGNGLRPFVQAIRDVAEFYSLPVLDLFATSGMHPNIPGQKKLYFNDTIHPNNCGHEKIAYMLKRFLELM